MAEYIEREKVLSKSAPISGCFSYMISAYDVIMLPAADVAPVRRGRWISDEGDVLFHCSECETQISTSWDYDDLQWNYCPNCGAKMDEEVSE